MLKPTLVAFATCLGATTSVMGQNAAEATVPSSGMRDMGAIKAALLADLQALQRISDYQEGVLNLAKEDPEDAFDARRMRRDCLAELNTPTLCNALIGSYREDDE